MGIYGIRNSDRPQNTAGTISVSGKSCSQAFSRSFHQQMDEQERKEYQEKINSLLDGIRADASALLKNGNLELFEGYRMRLSDLMEEIIHHAYLFQSERIRDGYGRRRVLATVSVVDRKMKQMGEELLSENRQQLDLMSRIDEIRGLIMDLFM